MKIGASLVFRLERVGEGFLFQLPLSLSFLGFTPGKPLLRKVMKRPAYESEYSRTAPDSGQHLPPIPNREKTNNHQELGDPERHLLRPLKITYLKHPPFTQFAFTGRFTIGLADHVKTSVSLTIATPPGIGAGNAVVDFRYVLHIIVLPGYSYLSRSLLQSYRPPPSLMPRPLTHKGRVRDWRWTSTLRMPFARTLGCVTKVGT